MTMVQIDPELARTGAKRLGFAVEAFERALVSLRTATAHVPEVEAVGRLLAELGAETGAVARVVSLTAERAATSDAFYGSMLDGWISSSLAALRSSVNDEQGWSVADLALASGGDPSAIDPALVTSMDRAGAEAWFDSLDLASQLALVATSERTFDGTAVAAVVDDWKLALDTGDVRTLYELRALDRAGIDADAWDPTLGLDHNAATVEAVYEYYADVYRNDTERLWWAGMAALIGPSFYGGFRDLDTFQDLLRTAEAVASVPALPMGPLPPGFDELVAFGSGEMADELTWYQDRLMRMQREIFFDMGPAHEAYLDGGIAMIERLYEDDPHDFAGPTIGAWRLLDEGWRTGDTVLIAEGNRTLLLREQAAVIADGYDEMRDRPVTGEAVTWAMTAVSAPSVPGARTFAEVFPLTLGASTEVGTPDHLPLPFLPDPPLPHVDVEASIALETPFPDGNISRFDARWALIEADTLPVYVDLAEHHPEQVVEILETPVGERATEYEIASRVDDLLTALLLDWELDPDVDLDVGW
jgi:hypothetical protein